MSLSPGSLVHARGKDWVVLPSRDPELLLLKPLDGTDQEVAGIYLPLGLDRDIRPAVFAPPTPDDAGDFASARLLHNAMRLSFRSGAGPFRCLGKLAFRPRGYQMVPLIMALRQAEDPLRLMIADDVGVGKTIEALLIVRELLDRKEIERFAVLCPPHLCDQWQYELQSKFGIDAVIVRSSTQARLDRGVRGDASVFSYYPYQIVSIDYIKGDAHRRIFVNECPELVLVDEVHACARPLGASETQQQRYRLLREIAARPEQGLVLLTATPHSGKTDEFRSLLGLLDPRFEEWDLLSTGERERRELAVRYVQRRRRDVELWQGRHSAERTPFPRRETDEVSYTLTPRYLGFYERLHAFTRALVAGAAGGEGERRMRSWSALTLLRGAMSSPASGAQMLRSRSAKSDEGIPEAPAGDDSMYDRGPGGGDDADAGAALARSRWTGAERGHLAALATELDGLGSLEYDAKAQTALQILSGWIADGFHPVVFCRFIPTAGHLGTLLRPELERRFPGVAVEVVTSEDPDEVRKARVEEMRAARHRLLIATDCLSEGINLQELFTAVLHYDLPWNPNRLEQREGRVDRYGQSAPSVKASLLYGADNPIDGVVLKVLLSKVREVRRSIGISIPFPEDSLTLMDAVMQAVLLSEPSALRTKPAQLDLGLESASGAMVSATRAVEEAARREEATRSIFAQWSIHAEEIEEDLAAGDRALGDPAAVEVFSLDVMERILGARAKRLPGARCHSLNVVNLPSGLRQLLEQSPVRSGGKGPRGRADVRITFESPVPEGFVHIGRTHPLVESLCRQVLVRSFRKDGRSPVGRAAAIRSRDVKAATTLLLFRARHVIQDHRRGTHLVAEETLLAGCEGSAPSLRVLDPEEAGAIMARVSVSSDLSAEARSEALERALAEVASLRAEWDRMAESRGQALAASHERFRRALERRRSVSPRYQAVTPVVPMDLVAVFVVLPETGAMP